MEGVTVNMNWRKATVTACAAVLIAALWVIRWRTHGTVPMAGNLTIIDGIRVHLGFLGPRWWLDILGAIILTLGLYVTIDELRGARSPRLRVLFFLAGLVVYTLSAVWVYRLAGMLGASCATVGITLAAHAWFRRIDPCPRRYELYESLFPSFCIGTGVGIGINIGLFVGQIVTVVYGVVTLIVLFRIHGVTTRIVVREITRGIRKEVSLGRTQTKTNS
jgi:hypothetical protein